MKPILLCMMLFVLPAQAAVPDAQVKDVAKELACLCGTCPRRPLHECICGTADAHRATIRKALEAGQTKDMIIAGFIQQFGKETLSTPPAEGFNLLAWIMPFAVLILGGGIVRAVIRNWSRTRPPAFTTPPESENPSNDPYLTRLEQDLKEHDS